MESRKFSCPTDVPTDFLGNFMHLAFVKTFAITTAIPEHNPLLIIQNIQSKIVYSRFPTNKYK